MRLVPPPPTKYLFILAALGCSCSMWSLVPRPGVKPGPPALEACSLSHWTARQVLVRLVGSSKRLGGSLCPIIACYVQRTTANLVWLKYKKQISPRQLARALAGSRAGRRWLVTWQVSRTCLYRTLQQKLHLWVKTNPLV